MRDASEEGFGLETGIVIKIVEHIVLSGITVYLFPVSAGIHFSLTFGHQFCLLFVFIANVATSTVLTQFLISVLIDFTAGIWTGLD
jgi:hypothetical protein